MGQQIITNLEGGGVVRAAINGNFTELYGALTFPLKLGAVEANQEVQMLGNCFIDWVFVNYVSGSPILSIGTTGGGVDILPATAITEFTPLELQEFISATQTLYLTITGGIIEVSFFFKPNVF